MSIRQASQIKGSIHDVTRLSALSGDDCHVLFVSSRTLYLLANFATQDVDFLSRYAKDIYDGGLVDIVDGGDAEEVLVREIANNFGLEVIPVCQELIDAIAQINVQLGLINGSIQVAGSVDGCCIPVGSNPADPAPDLEDPEVGVPPSDWEDWPTYDTYRCKAANKIADDWIQTLANMATLSGAAATIGALALAAFFSTSLLSGVLVGLMILGFSAFTAAAVIIGALVLMVLSGAGLLAYFADLGQDISDDKEALVCALYNAQSPSAAKSAVVSFTLSKAALISYDPGDDDALFQAQLSSIVNALFNESVTNTLYELDETVDVYVGDIDCDVCEDPCYGGDWFLEFDAVEGWTGWTTWPSRPFGTLSGGEWLSVWGLQSGIWDERLYIDVNFDAAVDVNCISVTWEFSGTPGSNAEIAIHTRLAGPIIQQQVTNDPAYPSTLVTTWNPTNPSTDEITMSSVSDASGEGAADVKITRVSISGSGTPPVVS